MESISWYIIFRLHILQLQEQGYCTFMSIYVWSSVPPILGALMNHSGVYKIVVYTTYVKVCIHDIFSGYNIYTTSWADVC